MEYHFSFEVYAPKGLEKLESELRKSKLDIHLYRSDCNQKAILKSGSSGIIKLNMDSSFEELMHGSGYIEAEFSKAKEIIESLSNVFCKTGFKHIISLDHKNGGAVFSRSSP